MEFSTKEPIPRIFILGLPSPLPYPPFCRMKRPFSLPKRAFAGFILERFISSLLSTEEAAIVVSSACSSVCSVTFSLCAQTGGITHRKDSDMIGINLFLILFFKFSIRNKGYHHPGFWIRPYALLISLLGNALRYHLGENLPGLAHCLSSPFSAGLNNLYS